MRVGAERAPDRGDDDDDDDELETVHFGAAPHRQRAALDGEAGK
jgi:hypothetical protein